MFSTTRPQLQPRTSPSQPVQPTVRSPPPRSASQPVLSQRNSQPPAKPEGVWADLISLQEPSANASLPLQYQTNVAPYGGMSTSSTMPASLSGLGSNPFGNVTGTSSSLAPFPQQNFVTNPFTQQQIPAQTSFASSGLNSSNSPFFQAQGQHQALSVPFYQPQPQQSSLTPSQTHPQFPSSSPNIQFSPNPQFLSSSPNPQLFSSHSPQMLSMTPTSAQQNSVLQPGFSSSVGTSNGMSVSGYLTPSPQPMMNGMHGQTQPQQPATIGNPFGQMQFGQGGFPGQNRGQWGPM
jgi:hypothetical protein